MHFRKTPLACLLFSLGYVHAPMTAFAQDTSAGLMEEIIVSVRRRDESLTDVPDSVKVFGASQIDDAGIKEITDVANLTPNLFISDYQEVGRADINMRGLGSVVVGDSPVAFLIDGVTQPSSLGVVQEIFDVQQIEVLRGPQGALYGRNAIGGAINVTTKTPSNEFEGEFRAGAAKASTYTASGSVSGPIIEDTLMYRVSAFYEESDGLFENAYTGEDAGYKDSTAVRGKLLLYPNDNVTVDLRLNWADKEGDSALWHWQDTSAANRFPPDAGFSPVELTEPLDTVQTNVQGFSEFENKDISVKLDIESGLGTWTYIGSYGEQDAFNRQDGDFAAYNSHVFRIADESESSTHELRLTSSPDQDIRYVLGLFYQEVSRERVFSFDASESCIALGAAAVPFLEENFFPGAACVFLDAIAYAPPLVGDTSGYRNLFDAPQELENEGIGVFAQVNIDVTERMELTLAARYDEEDRSDDVRGIDLTFDEFQPKVQLSYDLGENSLVYATYSTGFRPGGVNPTGVPQFQTYAEESLDNYEIGFKSSSGSSFFSGAVFYTEVDRQQLFLYNAVEATQNIFNANDSTIFGVELEWSGRIGESLDASVGLGYLDTEIEDFGNEDAAPFLLYDPAAVDGNKIPYNPELSANASLQHTASMSSGMSLISRLDMTYNKNTYWFFDNADKQSSATIVNLRISLDTEAWTVTAYANNLFDEDYDVSIFPVESTGLPGDFSWKGNPFTVGIEGRYRF